MSEGFPEGLALWQSLLAALPQSRQDTLARWLQGGSKGWHIQAQQSMATWPAPQRGVAAVLLYRDFTETSRHTSRIISENVMDQAPVPAEVLKALPWGMLENEAALTYGFQIKDMLRVLVRWSADPTEAVLARCSSAHPFRSELVAWLSQQPAQADVLAALAAGLADKSKPTVARCMKALVAHGAVAVPPLVAMLSARTTGTRRTAADALGQIGAPGALAALQAAHSSEKSAKTRAVMDSAIQRCAR